MTRLRPLLIRSVVDIGVFSFVINALLLVIPLYLLQLYDRVLPSSSIDTLLYLSIMAVVALGLLGLFDAVRSLYAQRVATAIDGKLGSEVFRASLGDDQRTAINLPLSDLATVRAFIKSRAATALFDLPFAPFFLVLLHFIHPQLFWLTLFGAALLLALVAANQLATGRNDALSAEHAASANRAVQAFTRNAETLRAMGMVRSATDAWGRQFADALDLQDRSLAANAIFGGLSRALRMMLQLAILGVGASLVLNGQMTAGMIFAASLVSSRALQPIDQLIGCWRQINDARRSWKRLATVLSASSGENRKLELPAPSGTVSAKDLIYIAPNAPAGAEPVIKRLNFQINAGESVAIVGPSGAGKSTLARLLVGAVRPTGGSVMVDGADLKTWDAGQLGNHIGYLAQDTELLPGSIAGNISRFVAGADDGSIIEAARKVAAHEMIVAQPDGYQTRIGPGGSMLSGGARQRIGLARALYGDPTILVLDEPDTHLDGEGEAALERMLAAARKAGCTTIIITHRPSKAVACDRVMLLREGRMEAFGPSGEVLRQTSAGKAGADTGQPARLASGSFSATMRASPKDISAGL